MYAIPKAILCSLLTQGSNYSIVSSTLPPSVGQQLSFITLPSPVVSGSWKAMTGSEEKASILHKQE